MRKCDPRLTTYLIILVYDTSAASVAHMSPILPSVYLNNHQATEERPAGV